MKNMFYLFNKRREKILQNFEKNVFEVLEIETCGKWVYIQSENTKQKPGKIGLQIFAD